MKSKVISARVPIDIAEMFEKTCKQRGITKSKYLVDHITSPGLQTFDKGGIVELPENVSDLLSVVGGTGIGILLFRIVNNGLKDKDYTENERLLFAGTCAVAGGLLSGSLLKQMTDGNR
tara:strand:+ start:746 stop:1102 length:357 start_codon:yes stop_codon:yes gene_type:complete